MTLPSMPSTIGVLASGGLDSCILLSYLLRQDRAVRPFYVRCGLHWESRELSALRQFLQALNSSNLEELVVFHLPLDDLYGSHWSLDGRGTPDAQSPDEAVYLPGRNALLVLKPALWCGMHGVESMALATLAGNPFADATDDFFQDFEKALDRATGNRVSILRPFARLEKKDILKWGQGLPLELSFSCLDPIDGIHCGRCNKCAERRHAFRSAGYEDPTVYNQ
jgi:7-cyano-7-deazaguanine synthase